MQLYDRKNFTWEVETMPDMKEEMMDLVRRSFDDDDIPPQSIPDIDLYMDQIITIFDQNLGGNKRYEDDKLLTKTMINNYSKEGVLKPIKGKKYTKEHIIQMLLIYNMKNTLTIQEIKRVLSGVYEEEDFDEKALEECYRQFLTFKQIERDTMPEVKMCIRDRPGRWRPLGPPSGPPG